MEITIDDKLYRNISDYCEVNQMDFCVYVNKLLKNSFMIDKYGESPFAKSATYEESPSNDNVQETIQSEEEKEVVAKVEEPVQEIKEEVEVEKPARKRKKKEEKKEELEPQVDSGLKIKEEPKKVLVKRRLLK